MVTVLFNMKYFENGTRQGEPKIIYLQWKVYRKSYMVFQMVSFAVILNDC